MLSFNDAAASLSGTGLVTFNNTSSSVDNTLQESVAGGTLTIGPHITITGGSGSIGYNSRLGGQSNFSVINQGTINASSAGTITIDGTGWSNTGTVEASGGGNLSLFGTGWTNSGTVTASGGTLNLGNNSWSNTGTVTATNTTTNLGGTFTLAKLGSFTRTGGAVNLTGTLNNTGGTLALNAATGSWNLAGGTIDGGTVTATAGAFLEATNTGGTLKDGVTLSGDPSLTNPIVLDLATSAPRVTISGGALTLTNTTVPFEATSFGVLSFNDAAASLSGTGLVTFNNTSSSVDNTLQENVAGGTLTIGPHITITGGSGSIGYNSRLGGQSNFSVINQGTINASSAGTITIDGTGWSNTGTVEASGGGNLSLFGTGWTNSGTVTASGGTLNLGNNSWSNTGTVTATNTTTNLGGTFTLAKLGSFTRTGGTVNLTGTLNNTGGTLALDATTGSWNLAGGTIDGGTVTATAGAFLEATNTGGTLKDGVTLSGDPSLTNPIVLDLATSAPRVTISGGALTLTNTTVPFEATSFGVLSFNDAAASLSGTGLVTFNNTSSSVDNTLQESVAGGTLTIGPHITITGGSGSIGYNSRLGGQSNFSVINQGTINASSAGTITIDGTGWSNTGTVEASGGGNLSLFGTGWTNSGTVTASGGTLNLGNNSWSNTGTVTATNTTTNLGGTFTLAKLGSFTRTGGTVNLTGTLNNTGGTLALDATTGSWNLAGGTIDGGTVTATGGAFLEATNTGGTLKDGVTLSGDPSLTNPIVLDLATSAPCVTISGGALTLTNTTVPFEATSFGVLSFNDAAASLSGTGLVTFNNTSSSVDNTLQESVAGGTLTIGPHITITGGSGSIGYNSRLGGPSNVSVINQGTINANTAGTITIDGTGWSNTGTVEASGGGAVTSTKAPTNFSGGTLTGGTWKVTGPGTLRVPFGSSVITNAANIFLDGTGAHFYRDAGTTLALSGFTTNAAAGSFTIQNSAGFAAPGAFSNAGMVTIGVGSTFVPGGSYTQTAGITALAGGVLGASSPATSVDLEGGSLVGIGAIVGSLTNAAEVSPGSPTGALTVSGSYSQTQSGNLAAVLAGAAAGQFSQLVAQGQASLGGTLNVTVANGFIAATGNTFPIVTAAPVSGQFANTSGLDAGSFTLKAIYNAGDVTLITDAAAAIAIAPTSGLITSQAGGTATFTAVLTTKPTGSVSFAVASDNTSAGTVSTSSLTFTTANWNIAQTVTITGVDDQMDDGDVPYAIVLAPAVSSDPAYNGFQPSNVSVVNRGTRKAGFSVTPTSGLVTNTAGATATFSVMLNSKPTAEVDVGLSSTDTSQGTVSVASLTFTPGDWNQPQIVTVTGVDGGPGAGNVGYSVVFAAASSADPKYNGLVPPSVSVTNIHPLPDLQVAGLMVVPSAGVQSGNTLLVQWNDANTGAGAVTRSFTDRITVTNKTTGNSLGTQNITYDESSAGPIAAGASISRQFSFTLPNATAGTGQIEFSVTTNAGNTVVESNSDGTATTNNTADATITSSLAPYPDLQVTSVRVAAPGGMLAGGSYILNWDDANSGDAATPVATSWTDRVIITNDTTGKTLVDIQVPYNASAGSSGPIPAGAARAQQYAFTLPGGVAGIGQIRFSIHVNANNAVFEFNSAGTAATNNVAAITQASALGNYPDLQVTALSVAPATGLVSGGSLTVTWSDSNTGTAAATGSWADSLVIKNKTTGQTLKTETLPYDSAATGNGPVGAGESHNRQYAYQLPDGAPGSGQIEFTVTANATGSLFEYNIDGTASTNNVAVYTATSAVAPYADLQVGDLGVDPPSGLHSSANLILHWSDANQGTGATSGSWDDRVVITNTSTGKTLSTVTLLYDATKLGNLAAGSSAAQQYAFTLPSGADGVGTIEFTVTTDVLGQIFEYNGSGTGETNNTAVFTVASGLRPPPTFRSPIWALHRQPACSQAATFWCRGTTSTRATWPQRVRGSTRSRSRT